jgi:peptidoglycan hydrolase CwlO-like protein
MNKTIFIAAILAVTTVLAAGLTVLPSSVQDVQANPCATEVEQNTEIDAQTSTSATNAQLNPGGSTDNRECSFIGPVDIDED